MLNQLAGHTNSFHTHGFDEALAGIAEAGYRYVELSAVPGWTEHVDLEHPDALAPKLAEHGLEPASLSAHSELTTRAGGVVDFARVLEILRVGGYAGPYSVELEFRGEPWPPLAEVTQSMRRSREHLRGLGLE